MYIMALNNEKNKNVSSLIFSSTNTQPTVGWLTAGFINQVALGTLLMGPCRTLYILLAGS